MDLNSYWAFLIISVGACILLTLGITKMCGQIRKLHSGNTLVVMRILQIGVQQTLYKRVTTKMIKEKELEIKSSIWVGVVLLLMIILVLIYKTISLIYGVKL